MKCDIIFMENTDTHKDGKNTEKIKICPLNYNNGRRLANQRRIMADLPWPIYVEPKKVSFTPGSKIRALVLK